MDYNACESCLWDFVIKHVKLFSIIVFVCLPITSVAYFIFLDHFRALIILLLYSTGRWGTRVIFSFPMIQIQRSNHRCTGSKICGVSPFNSKSDGNSSPTEIPSIRGLQRALESLKEPQTASEKPQKPLREPKRALGSL